MPNGNTLIHNTQSQNRDTSNSHTLAHTHTPVLPWLCIVARFLLRKPLWLRGCGRAHQMPSRTSQRDRRPRSWSQPLSSMFWIFLSSSLLLIRLWLCRMCSLCHEFYTTFVLCALVHVSLFWCLHYLASECRCIRCSACNVQWYQSMVLVLWKIIPNQSLCLFHMWHTDGVMIT